MCDTRTHRYLCLHKLEFAVLLEATFFLSVSVCVNVSVSAVRPGLFIRFYPRLFTNKSHHLHCRFGPHFCLPIPRNCSE